MATPVSPPSKTTSSVPSSAVFRSLSSGNRLLGPSRLVLCARGSLSLIFRCSGPCWWFTGLSFSSWRVGFTPYLQWFIYANSGLFLLFSATTNPAHDQVPLRSLLVRKGQIRSIIDLTFHRDAEDWNNTFCFTPSSTRSEPRFFNFFLTPALFVLLQPHKHNYVLWMELGWNKTTGRELLMYLYIYYWRWPFGIWIHEPVFFCFFFYYLYTDPVFFLHFPCLFFLCCITHGLVWCTCILTCKRLKVKFQKRSFFYLSCIDHYKHELLWLYVCSSYTFCHPVHSATPEYG